jgi:FKBP-type peptidyl-prolyl cis-trans isomerase 2
MKTYKPLFAILVAVLALGLTGCPDSVSPPGPDPEKPKETYKITHAAYVENGVFSAPTSAVEGDTVTVTVKPDEGYELDGSLKVSGANNFPVEDVTESSYNEWTFVMPAADVTIGGKFDSLGSVIENKANGLNVNSSWDEIDKLNELIKKAHATFGKAVVIKEERDHVKAAVELLAGKRVLVDSNSGLMNSYYPDEFVADPKNLGLIREKMEKEDITKWTSDKLASHPIDYHKYSEPDDTSVAITYLYYQKTEISGSLPDITLPLGWKDWKDLEKIKVPIINSGNNFGPRGPGYGALPGHADVIKVKLVYIVGDGKDEKANIDDYYLHLIPNAQYKVTYDQGVSGTIVIDDRCTSIPTISTPPTGGVRVSKTGDIIGDVGTVVSGAPSLLTVLYSTTPGIKISVTDAHLGTYVKIWDFAPTNPEFTLDFKDVCLEDPPANKQWGCFVPESRVYNVRVYK